jgi:glycerol transport system ATP-binding protein
MLNIMSGLLVPSQGTVKFDGVDVTRATPQQRNIAQVFQFPVIYDTMTVAENLAFPLRNRKVPEDQIKKRVGEIAEMLDMSGQLNQRAAGAGGRRQAENLAGPRPGAARRVGRVVRRAAHGD